MATKAASVETKRRRFFNREPRNIGNFAMVQPHKALARSPALRSVIDESAEKRTKSRDIGWQIEAYEMAREVGEAGYVMNLTANTVALCDFAPRLRTPEGLTETTDDRVVRVMEALVGPRGGFKEIKRRLALHGCIAGEFYLVGTAGYEGTLSLGILWEALSVREIEIDTRGKVTRSKDGGPKDNLGDDTYIARGWIADAEYSDRADSQMHRALTACKEVAIHGQVIDATSKSRIAAGILVMPEEMSFGGDDEEEQDEDEMMDALSAELLVHLSAPVEDRTSAASIVPLVLRGPGAFLDKVRLVDLGRKLDVTAIELRDKALARMATMLDIPPEIMTGKSALNHWTAYNVDADFLGKHVAPLGELIADFLTVAYLRPMLETYEGMDPMVAADYELEFDTAPVSARADEAKAALDLHKQNALSDMTLVRSSGFDVGDMPTPDELRARRALELVHKWQTLAPYLLRFVPGFEDVDLSEMELPGKHDPAQIAAQPGADPNAPEEGLPAPGPGAGGPGATDDAPGPEGSDVPVTEAPMSLLVERLAVAADSAADRAMEKAGARLLSKGNSAVRRTGETGPDSTLRALLATADKAEAFRLLSPEELAATGLSPEALFEGAWDRFQPKARQWVRQWLVSHQAPDLLADDVALLCVTNLCESLTEYLTEHLHSGRPAHPNGLRVPTALIEEAVLAVLTEPLVVA